MFGYYVVYTIKRRMGGPECSFFMLDMKLNSQRAFCILFDKIAKFEEVAKERVVVISAWPLKHQDEEV